MRRSLSLRFATLILAASLAAPALAAPRRDDSPMDSFERIVSRILSSIHQIFDLGDVMQPPK